MKRKIFASRNHNNKGTSAAAPAAIDVITLDMVVTDLRAAPSSTAGTTSTTRYQPFYQITNRQGKVLGRSAIVWDCVLDASFPTVSLSWNDVVDAVENKNADASTSSAAVVMREPLLITLYDFSHHHHHQQQQHHTHTILGQVQTTLLELVDKTVPQQSAYNYNSNASTLLSLTEDDVCRFAVIWEDVAVVGDLYVKDIQFHQSAKGRHRRRLSRRQHSLSPPPTHFEAQPGFPHLRNVLAPPGIPADAPPENECTRMMMMMMMSTYTPPNVNKSSSRPFFGSFDHDDTLSTAETEPWTEPSTSYCESPPASPRAQVQQARKKSPPQDDEEQQYYHCAEQQYQERSQELLEATRRRREQHQLRLQRGKDDHGVVVLEPPAAQQRPHGYYQYAQGRTEDLIARAKRLVSDRTSNLGKFKEQHNMFGGADCCMGCVDL